jgi:lipocalin
MKLFVFCVLAVALTLCGSAHAKVSPPVPVAQLNVTQFLGRWFQMYQDAADITFQGNGTCSIADYSADPTRAGYVTVRNSQLLDGNVDQIAGYAYYADDKDVNTGKLTVHLDGVPHDAPYWVLALGEVDNDQYQWAVVSDYARITLFVLARDVSDFQANYDAKVVPMVQKLGFNTPLNKPLVMPQPDSCTYLPVPKQQ